MRVATRRLRAILSLFKALLNESVLGHLKEELRWLQQQLGPARDWDVFLEETLTPLELRMPREEALAMLREKGEALREVAYDRARAVVSSRRYTALLLRLQLHLADEGWFKKQGARQRDLALVPMKSYAAELLGKRQKQLRKLGKKHDELTELQLHQLSGKALP